METVSENLSSRNVNIKSCFVLCHQTENPLSKLWFNSDEDKCIQSHVELFNNKIMSLFYDIMTLIDDNIILQLY